MIKFSKKDNFIIVTEIDAADGVMLYQAGLSHHPLGQQIASGEQPKLQNQCQYEGFCSCLLELFDARLCSKGSHGHREQEGIEGVDKRDN